jgi:malate dehydrogenase (oxaloacetate-decarboxylating)(NADP+)
MHIFGKDYIIPNQFDPRLYIEIAYAVAKTAMETGVATRPILDMKSYKDELSDFVHKTHLLMQPIVTHAKIHAQKKRIVFAEGEDWRVLESLQTLLRDDLLFPILIGRPEVIKSRMQSLGLTFDFDKDIEVVNPNCDERFEKYWGVYHEIMERKGITVDMAKMRVRTNTTIISALMVKLCDADGMICGAIGSYFDNFNHVHGILGTKKEVDSCSSLCGVLLEQEPLFFCDPFLIENPTETDLVHMTLLAVQKIKHFGIQPKVAFVCHSNFGTSQLASAVKMQNALAQLKTKGIQIEGEMQAHLALDEKERLTFFPNSSFKEAANLLIFPNIEAANVAYNMAKTIGKALTIGPILMGLNANCHILTPSSTVRDIINMSVLSLQN